jgi:hydroxypyruvate isomerase
MPKLAANLTTLFNELDFLDRFRAAADAGFKAVECQFPYAYEPIVLKRKLADCGLEQVLHNLPAGDWAKGERGIACLPDRVAEFRAGVDWAIDYATVLGCRQVNCLAGVRPLDVDEKDVLATFVNNLRYAASRLRAAGIRLLIEPINTRDVPGFFLCRTSQALDIIEAVEAESLFLQYDVYHMQIMEGDLSRTIERNIPRIAHVQIADTPGRHEPGTGEINYPFLLRFLDRIGYSGWIGCEYTPTLDTHAGLGWADAYLL